MDLLDDDLAASGINEREEEWAAFVGENSSEYYINAWREIQAGKRINFNIGAFFFGMQWAVYRKMYVWLAPLILINVLPELLFMLDIGSTYRLYEYNDLFSSIFNILFALTGNYWYYNHANKKILEIKGQFLGREQQLAAIREAGGTNLVLVLGMTALIFLIIFLS